jgi:beta-lactamase regulating signal transducer with metallopeptidase domain
MSTLSGLFTTILNMSITASYVAVAIILVRLLLRKAPKIFSYALWAVVLFRLICPLSFTSAFSILGLLNVNSQNNAGVLEYVSNDIGFMQEPTVQSGIGSIDSTVNSSLPQTAPIASVNPMQIWMDVFSLIWLAGIVVLLSYSVISYIKIKRQLLTATLVKDNIYESDLIGTAFVCGFIHPKIYVPVNVGDADLSYILEHERTHIRRRDYLIKPFAFFALILHWFNPLMWLSFALMSRDMEMSCDESVLQKISQDAKGGYSSSLLSLSVKRTGLFAANPLAFGESHVKARIKNVLNYKKPVFWVIIASVVVIIGAGIALLSNPTDSEPDLSFLNPNSMLSWIGEHEQIKISSEYGDTAVSGRELAKWLDVAENDWKRKNVSSPYELSPSITIHVNDETINEIRFFESEPTLAMIVYQDKFRYYKIPEEDYVSMKEIAGSGYPQVQNITFTEHENGNDAASVTITDSKTIMQMAVLMQSGEKYNPSLFFDSTQNDTPPVSDYIRIEMSGDKTYHSYFLYTEDEKNYYIDRPYDHINKIDFNTMKEVITIFTDAGSNLMKDQIGFEVESKLDIIMSSPKTSSNPQDYINAHQDEYEYFFKYGGEDALQYMLTQFEAGNAEGLRGQIMMQLCKELLGKRNNVTDESLSPQEWYNALSIRQEISLPHFEYDGQDQIEKLVYDTEVEKNSDSKRGGFMVVAPKIFGSYEEENLLKVFVTTYSARYKLYGNTLSQEGGSIIPAAITYRKDDNGRYVLEKYEQARDGSEFGPSVREYCTMPVSGKEIEGLADKIFKHYGDYEDIRILLHDNLFKHLKKNDIKDATLTNSRGEVEFSMSNPKYKP